MASYIEYIIFSDAVIHRVSLILKFCGTASYIKYCGTVSYIKYHAIGQVKKFNSVQVVRYYSRQDNVPQSN